MFVNCLFVSDSMVLSIDLSFISLVLSLSSECTSSPPSAGAVTSASCHYVMPGLRNASPIELIRILRIAFLRPLNSGNGVEPNIRDLSSRPQAVTFRTVVPEVVPTADARADQRWRTEPMKQLFGKALAVLQQHGS